MHKRAKMRMTTMQFKKKRIVWLKFVYRNLMQDNKNMLEQLLMNVSQSRDFSLLMNLKHVLVLLILKRSVE
jgi:hypothetical protein